MINIRLFSLVALLCLISCHHQDKAFTNTYSIPYLNNITVDGNAGDWNDLGLIIPLITGVWGEMDPGSFSATVSLAWDESYLYLLAKAADDTLYQDNSGPIWRNDGLEIFLAERKGAGNIIQYLVAPSFTDDFPEAVVETNVLGDARDLLPASGLLMASHASENGYVVELGIPFASLGISPARGDTVALNFYLGDADSSSKHTKYSWHYNDNTYLNHDALYQVVLSGKGRQHHVLTRAWLTDTVDYSIELVSMIPFDGDIHLMQGEKSISKTWFEPVDGIHHALFEFKSDDVSDYSQPLQVILNQTVVSEIEWFDIPRRYVHIPAPRRFANEILMFEKEDARSFPPRGATLFVGSSSIRLWQTLAEDIPGITFINRGFGGSQTDDILYYFNRVVAPYHPTKIVYFTGTNDLAAGRTPEETVANVEEFIVRSNNLFPGVKIYILSNTIAVSRKHLHERYHQANRLLKKMLENYDNAVYVDVTSPGLTPDGRPRPEIYTADSLHLNREGYMMWGDILRPLLTGKQ